MPGPIPKPSALRQRRNRVTTAAVLNEAPEVETPPLPKRRRRWHPMTVQWWQDVWQSPMAPEFLPADVHGLYLLAELRDRFWREPSAALAAEIRQQEQRFGLSPIDRRRLQWEVPRGAAAPDRPGVPSPDAGDDPRKLLALV
jgi:hypothetical protein